MNRFQNDECLKEKVKHPSMYAVIYWNDHVTTADFVIRTLMDIFGKDIITAKKLTSEVDTLGKSQVGVYTRDIAETKKNEVIAMAKLEKFPFKVTIEPVNDEEEEE